MQRLKILYEHLSINRHPYISMFGTPAKTALCLRRHSLTLLLCLLQAVDKAKSAQQVLASMLWVKAGIGKVNPRSHAIRFSVPVCTRLVYSSNVVAILVYSVNVVAIPEHSAAGVATTATCMLIYTHGAMINCTMHTHWLAADLNCIQCSNLPCLWNTCKPDSGAMMQQRS